MNEKKNSFLSYSDLLSPVINSVIIKYYGDKKDIASSKLEVNLYDEIMNYCTRPGKRVRPLLVVLGYKGYTRRPSGNDDIFAVAAAIEMMHAFLLIQDDIIDKSPLRRGEKSLHLVMAEKYSSMTHSETVGADTALVLADVLFANALELINNTRFRGATKSRFMHYFAMTYEKTAFGQILDVLNSLPRKLAPGNTVSSEISLLKTAYYTIYYPLLMGYLLSGKNSSAEMIAIKEFSLPLGLAFQLRDDIQGAFGSEDNIGKPSDSDIHEGKLTGLVQDSIDSLSGRERKEFIKLFTINRKKKTDVNRIRKIIVECGALERAKQKHSERISQSRGHLPGLKVKKAYKDVLQGLIDLISDI